METNTIADSAQDFSNSQGSNGWYYGYYSDDLTAESFKQLPYFYNENDIESGWWHAG